MAFCHHYGSSATTKSYIEWSTHFANFCIKTLFVPNFTSQHLHKKKQNWQNRKEKSSSHFFEKDKRKKPSHLCWFCLWKKTVKKVRILDNFVCKIDAFAAGYWTQFVLVFQLEEEEEEQGLPSAAKEEEQQEEEQEEQEKAIQRRRGRAGSVPGAAGHHAGGKRWKNTFQSWNTAK